MSGSRKEPKEITSFLTGIYFEDTLVFISMTVIFYML